jgi:hypothetical protein
MHAQQNILRSQIQKTERAPSKIEKIATLFNIVIEYNTTTLISTIKIKKREI